MQLITTDKVSKERGFILYEGPSLLDGESIVVIATMKSANVKTGNMVQTWVLRSDINPVELGKDRTAQYSVCGVCPHQQSLKGACYVNLGQAPAAVYKSYKRGLYPYATNAFYEALKSRSVRLGAFGDPAAAPYEVWSMLTMCAKSWTGYTHQATHKNFDTRLAAICQISADTEKQATRYHAKGWPTFRVAKDAAAKLAGEIVCPSESKGTKCIDCTLCDGISNQNIVITVHGSRASRFAA